MNANIRRDHRGRMGLQTTGKNSALCWPAIVLLAALPVLGCSDELPNRTPALDPSAAAAAPLTQDRYRNIGVKQIGTVVRSYPTDGYFVFSSSEPLAPGSVVFTIADDQGIIATVERASGLFYSATSALPDRFGINTAIYVQQ